jgi:hypothetical protein
MPVSGVVGGTGGGVRRTWRSQAPSGLERTDNALVPKLDLLPGEALAELAEEFEVAYTDVDAQQRLPLSEVWTVPFESCRPVRGFPSYKGQRNLIGRWWTATTGTLIGYE